ncbi:hypothetical protein P7K49_002522 [Saguinus oedipus]|uniref:Uncharacterized protein n=1 Tax=Saguinus oedipus TaxID=9490 RepID=A0ABQ9WHK8_SAGOE|nr:hypothetical protein P7K49_002522 [Saguinus oedipus]
MEATVGHLREVTSDEVNQDQILWRLPDQTKQQQGHGRRRAQMMFIRTRCYGDCLTRPSSMDAMMGHLREKVTSDDVHLDQMLWGLPDQTKQHEGHGGSPEGEGEPR